MTTAGEPLAIRAPTWARVLGPLLLAGWLSALLVPERARDGVLLLGALVALLAAVVLGRMLMTSVIGTLDGRLTVRNTWSTRTFARPDVVGVDVDRAGSRPGRGWAVWLLLDDGARHRLDVTEVPFLGPSAATLEHQAAAVRTWLEGGQPSVPLAYDTR